MATTRQVLLGLVMYAITSATTVGKGPIEAGSEMLPGTNSVAELRARGPAGLEEALRVYDKLQAELATLKGRENELHGAALFGEPSKDRDPKIESQFAEVGEQVNALERRLARTAAAIDRIGGQRSCSVSRLYWFTDLEQAKAESARTGDPILSLRMLGKLTDEYSCANSRFFRTALYSNQKLSEFLRNNFVLHWQSVRPVPRVTIDFGDGRKLERTLTGNSAHYVLASDGAPIDVLPGLYSPLAFHQWAWDVRSFYSEYQKIEPEKRVGLLQAYHAGQKQELLERWDSDIQRLGGKRAELARLKINNALQAARSTDPSVPADVPAKAVNAAKAAKQAVGKYAAEAPMLRFAGLGGTWMERGMDEDLWQGIADLHREDVKLDEASVALMRREAPPAPDAARRAVSKARIEDPILRVVRAFEASIALDTVRNEYLLHRRVHEEFANGNTATANADTLNEWVYAELFLTPSSDPWLGLAPRDVYTALDGDGRTGPVEVRAERTAAGASPFTDGGGR